MPRRAAMGLPFGGPALLAFVTATAALIGYLVAHNHALWAVLAALVPIPVAWIMRAKGNGFLLAVTVILVIPYWYAHVWLLPPILVIIGMLRGTARPRLELIDLAFLAVVAVFLASWLFHSDLDIPTKQFVEGMLPFGFYLWARLNVDSTTLPRLQRTMLVAGAVAACTVLYEAFRGVAVFVDPQIYQWAGSDTSIFRAGGIFGGSPTAATVLSVVLLCTLAMHRVYPRGAKLLFGVIFAAILVTLDRAGVLGLMVGVVLLALLLPYRRWTRVAWVALVIVVATFAVTSSSSLMSQLSNSKIVTQGIVRSNTVQARQDLLADSLALVADSPSHLFFGRGFDAFVGAHTVDANLAVRPDLWVSQNGPNDDYVRAILEQGLVGLLAILVWLGGSLWIGIRAARRLPSGSSARLLLCGLSAATLAYIVAAAGHDMTHNIAALSIISLVTGTLVSAARMSRSGLPAPPDGCA